MSQQYNGKGEAEIVMGDQLSAILRKWTVEFLKGGKFQSRNGFKSEVDLIGPQQYLSQQTGIHIRRISALCNGEYPHVPLSQADKLIQAIEWPHVWVNEIQVVPNPNWSVLRWVRYMEERTHCLT